MYPLSSTLRCLAIAFICYHPVVVAGSVSSRHDDLTNIPSSIPTRYSSVISTFLVQISSSSQVTAASITSAASSRSNRPRNLPFPPPFQQRRYNLRPRSANQTERDRRAAVFDFTNFDPRRCMIYVNKNSTAAQRQQFSARLNTTVGAENVREISLADMGIQFWETALTNEQRSTFLGDPAVNGIGFDDDPSLWVGQGLNDYDAISGAIGTYTVASRAMSAATVASSSHYTFARRALETLAPAVEVLQKLSQKCHAPRRNEFLTDDSAGLGSTIYIIDSGLNIRHSYMRQWDPAGYAADEARRAANREDWHDPNDWQKLSWIDLTGADTLIANDQNGHGSGMWQYSASLDYGAAPRANIVVVKVHAWVGENGGHLTSLNGITKALTEVANRVEAKRDQPMAGNSIILCAQDRKLRLIRLCKELKKEPNCGVSGPLSSSKCLTVIVTAPDEVEGMEDEWKNAFRKFQDSGATFVLSAGNKQPRKRTRVTSAPALWKLPGKGMDPPLDNVLIIGAIGLDDRKSSVTRYDRDGDLIDIWALGDLGFSIGLESGKGFRTLDYKTDDGWVKVLGGTSTASASVAGVAAWRLGLPNPPDSPAALIAELKRLARPGPGDIKILNNGLRDNKLVTGESNADDGNSASCDEDDEDDDEDDEDDGDPGASGN